MIFFVSLAMLKSGNIVALKRQHRNWLSCWDVKHFPCHMSACPDTISNPFEILSNNRHRMTCRLVVVNTFLAVNLNYFVQPLARFLKCLSGPKLNLSKVNSVFNYDPTISVQELHVRTFFLSLS